MITVSRSSQFSNKFVPIGIYIDGAKVGSLRDGERSGFSIKPGEHIIQAKVNISASNIIKFQLYDNQNIGFELGSNVNVIRNILLSLSHPVLLIALLLLSKIIEWKYFLVFSLLSYIVFEAWIYITRRRKIKTISETEKYYLYLRRTDSNHIK